MSEIVSRPYKPKKGRCCEACVFGRGRHALFCEHGLVVALRAWTRYYCGGCGRESREPKPGELITCQTCGINGLTQRDWKGLYLNEL